MPRRPRQTMGGLAYHVLNRAVGPSRLFTKDADYARRAAGELARGGDWPESETERESIRNCVQGGAPYDEPNWQHRTAVRLGLESSLRPRGRPPKTSHR
ncbi:MAG: hypothetical protein HY718_20050 [Planctomycetes bacterium]|nr:hypothetical protein [Planctomycetota bacterium]